MAEHEEQHKAALAIVESVAQSLSNPQLRKTFLTGALVSPIRQVTHD